MALVLSLLLSLVSSSPAQAADPAAIAASAVSLVQAAQKDVAYLNRNVANCTRFASTIQSQLVNPISQDLQGFAARLARYSSQPPRSCTSRADLDFISATIAGKLQLAATPQSQLMGMTGDEAMTKALSGDEPGDDRHPDCRPQNPNDLRTTPELKTYFALKNKLIALRIAVNTLKNQTDCVKQEN